MDQLKLIEMLLSSSLIYIVLAVLVWLLTYLVKKPIKAATAKIKDAKKRKVYNKWILLIPLVLAYIAFYLYVGFKYQFWPVDWEMLTQGAIKIAVFAIVIYNVAEGFKGNKTEYQIDPNGAALFDLLLIYSKDASKVKMLLDQCKENIRNDSFKTSDTVKGWLPPGVDYDVVNTIVKAIEKYFKDSQELPGITLGDGKGGTNGIN